MHNGIHIEKERYEQSPGSGKSVSRQQHYRGTGLERVEIRSITGESDYANELYVRYSPDNGRTWSDWQDRYEETFRRNGDLEMIWRQPETGVYNPVHRHYVSLGMQRIFLEDHRSAYEKYWSTGAGTWTDHTFLYTSAGMEEWQHQLVAYEDGPRFNDDRWNDPAYVATNRAYAGVAVEVLNDGDIVFPVAATMRSCCRIRGFPVQRIFPSLPDVMKGLIVFRGRWNAAAGQYDLSASEPVIISDLQSSRGVAEPLVLPLATGRIIAVFRGSNVISEGWGTRIQPGTPAHKWYCFSDDGGATFTHPVPWHFDNAEVFYSPATISRTLRSRRNGRAYWFGNITGPEAYANSPRYPLVLAEVDETTGFLKRDTFTVIDDRDPEHDAEGMQLSNFGLLDDRETGTIELYVTRLGANPADRWQSDAYRYRIELG